MNEINTKYYKTYRGIFKLKEDTLESFTINYFDYVISSDKQKYNKELVIEYLEKAEAKEITKEEYNSIYITFDYLKEKQHSLYQNIKKFIDNNLKDG